MKEHKGDKKNFFEAFEVTHPNLIFYRGIGAIGVPRHRRPYSEPGPLQVHEEVALRTRAGVAVAVAARGELLRSSVGAGELIIIVDDLKCVDVDADFIESREAVMNGLVLHALPIFAFRHVGRSLAVEKRIVLLASLSQRNVLQGIVGFHVVTVNLHLAPTNIDFVFAVGAGSLVVLDALARAWRKIRKTI